MLKIGVTYNVETLLNIGLPPNRKTGQTGFVGYATDRETPNAAGLRARMGTHSQVSEACRRSLKDWTADGSVSHSNSRYRFSAFLPILTLCGPVPYRGCTKAHPTEEKLMTRDGECWLRRQPR